MYKIIIIYVGYKNKHFTFKTHLSFKSIQMYRYFDVFELTQLFWGLNFIFICIASSLFMIQQPLWFHFRFRLNNQEKRNFQNAFKYEYLHDR